MESLKANLDKILAALTVLLAGGYLEHWFSQGWLVLLSAILTFFAEFLPHLPTSSPGEPLKGVQPGPGSPPKAGKP